MRFLIDQGLSPKLAQSLRAAGHDALHTEECGLGTATDDEIARWAIAERRCVVSADTDFGELLAVSGANAPSLILFRGTAMSRPDVQFRALLANLTAVEAAVQVGSVVVFGRDRLRIRPLPLGDDRGR